MPVFFVFVFVFLFFVFYKGDRLTENDDRDKVALNVPIEMLQHTTSFLHVQRSWWTMKGFYQLLRNIASTEGVNDCCG